MSDAERSELWAFGGAYEIVMSLFSGKRALATHQILKSQLSATSVVCAQRSTGQQDQLSQIRFRLRLRHTGLAYRESPTRDYLARDLSIEEESSEDNLV